MASSRALARPLLVLLCVMGSVLASVPFSYLCSGKKAATCAPKWPQLPLDDNQCGSSLRQSPIDLPDFANATCGIHKFSILPHYQSFELCETEVVNSGQQVKVRYPRHKRDPRGELVWNGVRYNLRHIDFHTPAEHTINGVTYPFELHLVHKKCSEGRRGAKRLVIAVLYQEKNEDNRFLRSMLRQLPHDALDGKKKGGKADDAKCQHVVDNKQNAEIELERLFRHQQFTRYYTYPGSRTAPPCLEDVRWIVIAQPKRISRRQVRRFAAVLPESINNRPVQPLGEEQKGRVHASCVLSDSSSSSNSATLETAKRRKKEENEECQPECFNVCRPTCPQTCSVRCPRIKRIRKHGEWIKPVTVKKLPSF